MELFLTASWFRKIVFTATLLLFVVELLKALYGLFFVTDVSPLMPDYWLYWLALRNLLVLVPALMGCIGLIRLYHQKAGGWFLTCTACVFFSMYFISFEIKAALNGSYLYILMLINLLPAISLAMLLQPEVRQQFPIPYTVWIMMFLVSALLLVLDFYALQLSMWLSGF